MGEVLVVWCMCLLLDRILGTGILCVEKVDLPAPIFGLGLLVFGRSVGMNMGQPVLGCDQPVYSTISSSGSELTESDVSVGGGGCEMWQWR